jgi:hypothetical protein
MADVRNNGSYTDINPVNVGYQVYASIMQQENNGVSV